MWSPELKHKLAELIGAISAVNDAANGGNAATAEQGCTLSLRFAQSNEAYGIAFELNCPDAFDMSIRPNRKPHPSASHDGDGDGGDGTAYADLREAHRRGKAAEHVRLVKEGLASARPGTTIRILHMEGEPHYDGRTGVVEFTDAAGQIHGTWGGLALQPERDMWEVLREP